MNGDNYQIKYTLTAQDNVTNVLNKIAKTLDDISRQQTKIFKEAGTLHKSVLEKQIYAKKIEMAHIVDKNKQILLQKKINQSNLDIEAKQIRNKISNAKLSDIESKKDKNNIKEREKLQELASIREKRRIAERGKEKIYWSQQELKYLSGNQKVRMQEFIKMQQRQQQSMSVKDMVQYGVGGYVGYEMGKSAINQAIVQPLKQYAGYQNLKLVSEAIYGKNAEQMYNLMEKRALKYGEAMTENESVFKQVGAIFPNDIKKQQELLNAILNLSTSFTSSSERGGANLQLIQTFGQLFNGIMPDERADIKPLLTRGINLPDLLGRFLKLKRAGTTADFQRILGDSQKIFEFLVFINNDPTLKKLLTKKEISLASGFDRTKQTLSLLSSRVGESIDQYYGVSNKLHSLLNSMLDTDGNLKKGITVIIDMLAPFALPAFVGAIAGIAALAKTGIAALVKTIPTLTKTIPIAGVVANGILSLTKILGPVSILLGALSSSGLDWSMLSDNKLSTMEKVLKVVPKLLEYALNIGMIIYGHPLVKALGLIGLGITAAKDVFESNKDTQSIPQVNTNTTTNNNVSTQQKIIMEHVVKSVSPHITVDTKIKEPVTNMPWYSRDSQIAWMN
jgi:hypothetical protein